MEPASSWVRKQEWRQQVRAATESQAAAAAAKMKSSASAWNAFQ